MSKPVSREEISFLKIQEEQIEKAKVTTTEKKGLPNDGGMINGKMVTRGEIGTQRSEINKAALSKETEKEMSAGLPDKNKNSVMVYFHLPLYFVTGI